MRLLASLFQLLFWGKRTENAGMNEWWLSVHFKGQVESVPSLVETPPVAPSLSAFFRCLPVSASWCTWGLMGPVQCAFIWVNPSFITVSFQRNLCRTMENEVCAAVPLGDVKKGLAG